MQVFLVAKDFGVRPAYHLAMIHPDRVSAVITVGVPFILNVVPFGIPRGFHMNRWRVSSHLLHLKKFSCMQAEDNRYM